jgi:hypothetical protein
LRGYKQANGIAMDLWEEVYPNSLLIALTDTFSTKAFFQVSEDSFTHVPPSLLPLKFPHTWSLRTLRST